MQHDAEQLRRAALAAAERLEFDLAGVAGAAPSARLAGFGEWIAAGRAGAMDYMERRDGEGAYLREDIRHAYPWARSVVCCGAIYNTGEPGLTATAGDHGRGWIARYAWGEDYHRTLRERMGALAAALPAAQHAIAVDTAPIVERDAAARAGLGWQGKNTCLIHQRAGSFFFVATLITALEIAPDVEVADRCGSCTRCLEACPTQALTPYEMDASRCLSYFNIELRGAIPEPYRAAMGNNIFGCDICQDVCPWNRRAAVTARAEFRPRAGLHAPALEELAAMSEEDYRARFRHSAVKRAKYQGIMRNVAVAMGNSGEARYRPALERLAGHADAVIAEHAAWGLRRLEE